MPKSGFLMLFKGIIGGVGGVDVGGVNLSGYSGLGGVAVALAVAVAALWLWVWL